MKRKLHVLEVPHAVILDQNTLRLVLLLQLHQMSRIKLFLVLDQYQVCPALFQELFFILIFSLFAEDQKSSSLDLKVRLIQRIADKFRFSAFQKAINDKHRFHIATDTFLAEGCLSGSLLRNFTFYFANSFFKFSSFSLDPITQNFPVTSGLPSRTLLSPGT